MTKIINGTPGADSLSGTNPGDPANPDGIDIIDGLAGNDRLFGLNGNDTLRGGAGADIMEGGDGVDTADYQGSASVSVNLQSGGGSNGDAQGDTLIGIENLIGSSLSDFLVGDGGANTLDGGGGGFDTLLGGGGNDQITGYGGADILEGQDGNDLLDGGTSADTLRGGAGTDTATYVRSTAGVQVDLTTGTGTGGDAAGDTLTDIENLIGSAFADTLTGNTANNNLTGGAGADVLDGGTGIDTASYDGSAAAVTADLRTGAGTGGDALGDTLQSIENLTGSAFGDTLRGNAGANAIDGGGGNDQIASYGGADAINGG
ncbi:calcium-binding protein, partial [Inquilinus sp. CA228]|uniref:calcium-binding protein n=1 Tax=Inquilinus sp. CA228 TaxID=3455609 RepID=UPI003F8D3CFF